MTALLASEDGLNEVLARRFLQSSLQSIEDQVEELLGILLLGSVRWLPIELLEGEAELHWVEFSPLRELQVSDHLLQLMHHAVVNALPLVVLEVFGLAVIDAEQVVAEGWNHEELLHHTVHIADTAQVAKTHICLRAFRLNLRDVVPGPGFLDSGNEWHELLIQESLHQRRAVLDQLVEQLISGFTALVVGCGCLFLVSSGALLLVEHNRVTASTIHLGLEVGGKEELLKDLADQVLILDDSVADRFVSLCNNLSSESD